MELTPLTTERAMSISKTLESISARCSIAGYLVGLLQDVKRCVEVNLKSDTDNDQGDERLIREILSQLSEAESNISVFLTTAIRKSDNNK